MLVLFLSAWTFSNVMNVYSKATDTKCQDVEGYYWRDFNGDIPSDAFSGGLNRGKPIYIGQVYNIHLIPAQISSNKEVHFEYGGHEHKATKNIKILCTRHPEQFEWIQTNTTDIKLLPKMNLINGGFEPGCKTYIGRVKTKDDTLLGKALTENLPKHEGLHVTTNGKGVRHTSYEVLSFNEDFLTQLAFLETPATSAFQQSRS